MEIISDPLPTCIRITIGKHAFNIPPHTTFHDIKQMISNSLQCKPTDFSICIPNVYDNIILSDTIENIQGPINTNWSLAYHNFNFAQIFIKTLTGHIITVTCSSQDRVINVMQKIFIKENIPIEEQRLIYARKQLEQEKTLYDCKLYKECTIHLILRLRGGMHHITSNSSYLLTDTLTTVITTITSSFHDNMEEIYYVRIKPTETIQHLLNTLKENKLLTDDQVILQDNINLETVINTISKNIVIKTTDLIKITYSKYGVNFDYKLNLNMTVQQFLRKLGYDDDKAAIVTKNVLTILDKNKTFKEAGLTDLATIYVN
jgi:ubiquitin-large subunit ribosomal protein L40e